MSGLFITFEGIDGCGKTTQLQACAARLRERGHAPIETREPGGTVAGNAIRELLLRDLVPPLVAEAELHLFAAARAQHVRELIAPSLASGRLILCDRYTDATVAYQGYGRRLDLDLIDALNRLATGGVRPDLTIVLDLPIERAVERIHGRAGIVDESPTRFDLESIEFHERVRAGYGALAAAEPERVRIVDASGTIEEVAARIDAALEPEIERWRSRS